MRSAALTRSELLDRLLTVFRLSGYEQASLTELQRATGLQKGGLYHHFPGGKADMADAVLVHLQGLFEEMIFTPLEQATTPDAGLAAMAAALERYFAAGSIPCLPALIGLSPQRDRFQDAISGFFRRWIEALAACYTRRGLNQSAARALAEQRIADVQGGIVLARALGCAEPFRNALARMTEAAGNDQTNQHQ